MEFRKGTFYYEEEMEMNGDKYLVVFDGVVEQRDNGRKVDTDVFLNPKESYATKLDKDGDGTDEVISITNEWEKYIGTFAEELVNEWECENA